MTVQALAACIRHAESGTHYTWGFGGVMATGDGGGAYQFEPGTWNYAVGTLLHANPTTHSPAMQDAAFYALYQAEGVTPWRGDACIGG